MFRSSSKVERNFFYDSLNLILSPISSKGSRKLNRLIKFNLNLIEKQVTPQHGISCQDILQSGNSVCEGEYLIDPEKDANPLKAFCDMITDGDVTEIYIILILLYY